MQLNRFNEIKLTWKNNFNELLDKKLFTKNNEGNNDVYLNTLKILLKNEIQDIKRCPNN